MLICLVAFRSRVWEGNSLLWVYELHWDNQSPKTCEGINLIHSYSNMARIITNHFDRSFHIQKRVWILFKNQFVSKMIYERIIKQNACEKVLFYKILTCSSFQRCRFKKVLGKPNLFVKALPNGFKSIFKQVSKSFDLNSFLKCFVLLNKWFYKRLWFPKPASKDQPQLEI